MKVNGANRHPRCSIPIPPLVCQSMLRKRILRHVGSAGAAGACDTVISSTCGEPTSERARASACNESVDRRFLSRSVNPVEFPVENRPKSSGAARGAEAPIQPIVDWPTQMRAGHAGARRILSGIGISLRAPETPRPPPPETWRATIDDVRMEQQLLLEKGQRLGLRAPGMYFRSVGQQKVV